MVRIILRTGGILALTLGLAAPSFAFAAYNDVTLTSSAVLTVNGITLNVTGNSNVVQSITVTSTNFTFAAQTGSQLNISAPNLNQLSQTGGDAYVHTTCNASASTMSFSFSNPATVTVTPSTSVCSNSSAGGGGGVVSGGGGGGGGGSSGSSSSVTTAVTTNTSTTGAAPSAAPMSSGQSPSSTAGAGTSAVTFARTLAYGATGADVSALQQLLINEGFFSGSAIGVFGPKTRAAVRAFQRKNGLKATGKADAATLAALGATVSGIGHPSASATQASQAKFTRTLFTRSRGAQVVSLQQLLAKLGFFTAAPNGVFGPKTKAAVKAFQKANGIRTNGVVGPATRAALNKQ